MPKAVKRKYYAVLNGRYGRKIIYDSWAEFHSATNRFSAASSKSFLTWSDAQRWLDSNSQHPKEEMISIPTPPPTPGPSKRPGYPNSMRYWETYQRKTSDVGIQTLQLPDFKLEPVIHVARETKETKEPMPLLGAYPNVAPPLPATVEIPLSNEQKHVLELVKAGHSLFFTGAAGTGKSVLLREIIKQLRLTRKVAVTATTGIAGLNIGGSTVHSFAGIGLGKETAHNLAKKIHGSPRLREKWTTTRVLIVDEISMMDATLFDKLEYIARFVRKCREPFGGIQLVLSGDFCQLPPVPEQSFEYRMAATYAFDARSWEKCITKTIFLTEVFRQKDNTFVDILSSMRIGVLKPEHIVQLVKLSRPLIYADGIEPSYIFPLRREVESCNNDRLAALTGVEHTYCSTDHAGYDYRKQPIAEAAAKILLERLVALPKITLKVGAQVMLIQNMKQGVLVNGSAGKVDEFLTTHEAIERHIQIAQPPNKGGTLQDGPKLPLEPDLRPLNNNMFGNKEKWPLIRFTNGNLLLCAPLEFTVEGFLGNVEARRLQVPLILAWALSVHKSQGQTLSRVKVDLGHAFEKGQAYVALSRATTMENLELVNFQPSKVMAHPRVIRWQEHWKSCVKEEPAFDEMDTEEAMSHYWDGLAEELFPPRR